MEHRGRRYRIMMAGCREPDGMLLELDDVSGPEARSVADVLYVEADGTMTFTAYEPAIPIELVEHLIARARVRLPPVTPPDTVSPPSA